MKVIRITTRIYAGSMSLLNIASSVYSQRHEHTSMLKGKSSNVPHMTEDVEEPETPEETRGRHFPLRSLETILERRYEVARY